MAALRILLVEDDDDNRELLAELLGLEGHEVAAAPEAQAALRLAEAGPFDVMVADVGLPGMDGLALARELRRRSPRLAVVAVSGYGDGADLARAEGRDVDAVVVKPAEPARLLAAIDAAVRRRRSAGRTP
jgi:CheY-like chemotaxis protein